MGWFSGVPPAFHTVAMSNVAVPLTGTTAETVLATIALPANVLGPNGACKIFAHWSYTNSANTKTMRYRLGAAGAGIAGTSLYGFNRTTQLSDAYVLAVGNRNALNAQLSHVVGVTGAKITAAINTGAAFEIALTGLLAVAGETLTLEAYCVELLRS